VFQTKIAGLQALLAATARDDLHLLFLFSSVAGRFGNVGQSDYAMANEVMNKVARAEAMRRGPTCLVRSLNWGPWDSGMVTPALRKHFEERGISLLARDEGAAAFTREILLATPGLDHCDVVLGSSLTRPTAQIERRVEIRLDPADPQYRFLDDHRIKGARVVPIVLAAEWFLRAASAWRPGATRLELSDIRALKGIVLEQIATFTLTATESVSEHGFTFAMSLTDPATGRLHYSCIAKADFGPLLTAPKASHLPLMPTETLPVEELYVGRLFHGPEFQVISTMECLGENGSAGRLERGRCLGWQAYWRMDVALLDGGLQLAILWGLDQFGRFSLPASIGRLVWYAPSVTRGEARCVQLGRSFPPYRTTSDIFFIGDDGELIAEMSDVDMIAVEQVHGLVAAQ
jgi:hypothetical protein